MLPQIGSSELLVIAIIALIVVGPKDLPMLLRKLGQFVARLRGMANDFRTSFDDMARQSELEDLRREVAAMRDAATAESHALNTQVAQLSQELHATDPAMAYAPLDPSAYAAETPPAAPLVPPAVEETPVEKVIKRRARVAAKEGEAPADAPAPARKPRAKKAQP